VCCAGHVPKLEGSQFGIFGMEFSEKSWIYLLAFQLLLSDGVASFAAALSGLTAAYLYESDGYGLQNFRLPSVVEVTLVSLVICVAFFVVWLFFLSDCACFVYSSLPLAWWARFLQPFSHSQPRCAPSEVRKGEPQQASPVGLKGATI
jgi:hypothetical protein